MEQVAELFPTIKAELAMRGEPTLNPFLIRNLEIIRELVPKIQVTLFTNGSQLLKSPQYLIEILDAGCNILNIDCYGGEPAYQKYLKLAESLREEGEFEIKDFREFTAYKKYPSGHKMRVVNLVPDVKFGDVDVRQIHNFAGAANQEYLESLPAYKQKELPLEKKCVRPFRELTVYTNGDINLCCQDWRGQCILGNLHEQTLDEIWYGEKHLQYLQSLYQKDRNYTPCDECDFHGGYRVGFLQNPFEDKE